MVSTLPCRRVGISMIVFNPMRFLRESHAVYTAIVQVLSMQSWKVAEQTLDQALAIHLSAEAASRSKVCVKQLYLLFGMHDHLSPTMAYAKLEKTLSEMRDLPLQLRVAISTYFETVIIYGVTTRLIEAKFAVNASSVPSMLDEYRWPHNRKRDFMQRLLTGIVKALAELRIHASISDGPSVSSAGEQAGKAIQRALDKYGTALPAQIVARLRAAALTCVRDFLRERVCMVQCEKSKVAGLTVDGAKVGDDCSPNAAHLRSPQEPKISSPLTTARARSHIRSAAAPEPEVASIRKFDHRRDVDLRSRQEHSCPGTLGANREATAALFREEDECSLDLERGPHWTVHDGSWFAKHARVGTSADQQGVRLLAECKQLCQAMRNSRAKAQKRRLPCNPILSAASFLRSIWLVDGI